MEELEGFERLRISLVALLFAAAMASLTLPSPALGAPFNCVSNHCGIAIDAPYPNLAVGEIDGIATPAQTRAIFLSAQKAGLWHVFPASSDAFVAQIQPVSISVAPGRSLTVLAATSETRLSNLQIGQFVRFAPHRGLHEKPRPDDPYWVGVGCVILLCETGDAECRSHYRPGLYRLSDGAELDASGRHVVPGGAVIDVYSMLPKKSGA